MQNTWGFYEMYSFKCNQQQLILHPDRVLFWEDESALILSDLHFGKTGHFRKSGIAVPQNVYKEDLQRLVSLIQYFDPRQLFIVGDLFHSRMNKELELFKRWRSDLSSVSIKLIRGNHDILDQRWYKEAGIETYEGHLTTGPFRFCHDPADCENDAVNGGSYTFTGHIHPGINIYGLARQSLRFPCFYFTQSYCVLPAFSRFTGTYSIRPLPDEKVFAIVNGSILKVG
jgi:uncharacterized protein